MERAVHWLEVVALAVIEFHGRVHPVSEPVEVTRDLKEVGLGHVRGVDELIVGLNMALTRVVLHHPADRASSGMKHRQTTANFVGEAEEIKLLAELSVVALLGFFKPVKVLGQSVLALPGCSIDTLQLRTLLVTAPVRTSHPHQLEVTKPSGRGHVRAAAQIGE